MNNNKGLYGGTSGATTRFGGRTDPGRGGAIRTAWSQFDDGALTEREVDSP